MKDQNFSKQTIPKLECFCPELSQSIDEKQQPLSFKKKRPYKNCAKKTLQFLMHRRTKLPNNSKIIQEVKRKYLLGLQHQAMFTDFSSSNLFSTASSNNFTNKIKKNYNIEASKHELLIKNKQQLLSQVNFESVSSARSLRNQKKNKLSVSQNPEVNSFSLSFRKSPKKIKRIKIQNTLIKNANNDLTKSVKPTTEKDSLQGFNLNKLKDQITLVDSYIFSEQINENQNQR